MERYAHHVFQMVGLDPHLLLPMKLLIYAVYRLVRTIILLESDLYTLARRLIQQEKAGNVEFFNIITRYRLDATDVAQDHDFLIFNDGFGTIGDLSDPCWLIYSITERYVYFVRIPDDPPLSMSFTQKLTLLLHNSADRVARIDIKDFSNEAKSRFPASKGRVVMLHNAPCCGGSMLGRLLSSSDLTQRHVLVLGEPPALSALAVLAQIVSIEVMRSVTLASLRYIMRHLESDQVVVMKTSWRLLEPEMVQKIGPKEAYEFALAQIMGCTINHQRNLKYYALEAIYAEDLMNDPLTVVRPVLDVCGLSNAALTNIRRWKSQEETAMQSTPSTPLNEAQRQRVKLLVEYLQQDWCR
ncbi:unnamed protein product [Heligmosomoides polygyrus]|uniref:tRNA (adenine(58)-N(1))-methyltransferase non-catalytic subunit TRM6 n=1 Tax=Heligmosomoides polygyrus TaxID=6339 RepID=A0A183FMG8_HELPZ|nr:unnamed protein product [Heligmosomoides polygyrus]